mmetsp:Transcript_26045/g.55145  ORF Transcript_26045/g.55145 Transcript_26045/m.55145 type:complete len:222 (-) Transcript_26045:338-1003(-)
MTNAMLSALAFIRLENLIMFRQTRVKYWLQKPGRDMSIEPMLEQLNERASLSDDVAASGDDDPESEPESSSPCPANEVSILLKNSTNWAFEMALLPCTPIRLRSSSSTSFGIESAKQLHCNNNCLNSSRLMVPFLSVLRVNHESSMACCIMNDRVLVRRRRRERIDWSLEDWTTEPFLSFHNSNNISAWNFEIAAQGTIPEIASINQSAGFSFGGITKPMP